MMDTMTFQFLFASYITHTLLLLFLGNSDNGNSTLDLCCSVLGGSEAVWKLRNYNSEI